MARILALSSQVARGHVGLSAITPALQALGHEVIALPTILLSNHPGAQPASGTRIDPAIVSRMLMTLHANGRLDGVAAVLTGYLPSPAHVAIAVEAIDLCRSINPNAVVLCDPVIGDDPKGVYIDKDGATAIRQHLLPRADIITPNRFELAWMTGAIVDAPETAVAAARPLNRAIVIATSIPNGVDALATLAITPTNVSVENTRRRPYAPNGTGDLLSALFLSAYLQEPAGIADCLARVVKALERVLDATANSPELNLLTVRLD